MILSVIAAFAVALIAPFVHRLTKDLTGWLLAIVPAAIAAYLITQLGTIATGDVIRESFGWVPGLGINFSFYLDGLSALFAIVVSSVGVLISIYGGGYLKGDEKLPRFYFALYLFMGSMLGVVLADNLITLFVFWELTSFSSYLLISYKHEYESARNAARQALLVTVSGGLALLGGVLLMETVTGTFEISEMLQMGTIVQESPIYVGIFVLIILGAFTKSAQFPFYFWLPNAMEAPTPVSAYLHSATMVKAGIYLLARLTPMLGGTDLWFFTLTGFGAVTMLVSAWLSVHYTDLKRILAYTTIMALGMLTTLLGIGTTDAIVAAVVFIVGHSLYKGTLFMVAGSIDHATGTRDVLALGGLRKMMPITFAAALLAGLSMAGMVGPFIGFIGKEIVYKAAFEHAEYRWALSIVSILTNVAIVVAAGLVCIRPFLYKVTAAAEKAHEAPVSMWIGPIILASLGLILGTFPAIVDARLFVPAASAILNVPQDFYLTWWHGVTPELWMTLLTLVCGGLLYWVWSAYRNGTFMRGFAYGFGVLPERGYDRALQGLVWTAETQTRFFQPGTLRYYLSTVIAVMTVLVAVALFSRAGVQWDFDVSGVKFHEWALAATILLAAFGAVISKTRLGAVLAAGVTGFAIAVIFLFFGAPDLAMTQFLIETLTAILVVLVIINIRKMEPREHAGGNHALRRTRDAVIALSAGAVMTLSMLAALRMPFDRELSDFFEANAYTEAHGRNIVNVILVDFRGLDTFGEIVVLAIAAIGIFALIRMRSTPAETGVQKTLEQMKAAREDRP
jgi:multicomponent Na+:H+ antiporter subunit A